MQFQKGQSGNPAGRPRGSRNKASIRIQEMLEEKMEELVEKLVNIALAGNIGALRLCLDRLLRAQANQPLLSEVLRLEKAADAVGAMAGIASAAAAGDVSADEAAKLAKVISLYVNTLEARDFEDRLVKLEKTDLKRLADPSNRAQSTIMPNAEP